MISQELQGYIGAARSYARSSMSSPTTLVHILLALLDDTEVQFVLAKCRVRYLDLRQETVEALAERLSAGRDTSGDEGLSALCLFALQAAQTKAAARGAHEAGVLDFVAALLEVHDNGSFDFRARTILTEAGLTPAAFAEARDTGASREPSHPADRDRKRREPVFTSAQPEASAAVAPGQLPPFCTDLTAIARDGGLDRCHGRETVLGELQVILGRRKKRNAVLVGDAGVGKTSVVEELACRIAEGRVSARLAGCRVYSLNVGALVGGTMYRGDLEERVKTLVATLSSDPSAILFIDEIHMLVSPTHSASAAADILKPALASGAVRCVGATTLSEYRRFFESDGAMSRRFAPVNISEPTREEALSLVRTASEAYAAHHGVVYPAWCLESAVDMSIRHMPGRRLPDKALELLDDIGSRAAMEGGSITPATVSACVEAKTGRNPDPDASILAVAALPDESRRIARAALRNSLDSAGAASVIGVVAGKGADPERTVREAAEALGRDYGCLDMSEFGDSASVSSLLGAPPGYVGHDNGGMLYEAARRSPGGILHLRNAGHAHPEAMRTVESCIAAGSVRDRTGRVAGLAGVQVVVSAMAGAVSSPIGFSREVSQSGLTGVPLVDNAATVVVIGPSGAGQDLRDSLARLQASARAAGADMGMSEGLAAHLEGILADPETRTRDFARTVRDPVLDSVLDGARRFTVEPDGNGIRIVEHDKNTVPA